MLFGRQERTKKMKKVLVLAIVLSVMWVSSADVCAVNYYVDATGGNDNLDGRSEANAWATIAKVNDYAGNPGFSGGDVICFKRGDTWSNDETLGYAETYVNWGPIDGLTIQDYGSGAKPRFDGNTQRPVFIISIQQLNNLTIKNIDVSGSDTSLERVQIQNVNGVVIDGVDYNGHTGSSIYRRSNCVNIINCTGTIEVKNCHIQNLVRDTWENTVSGWGTEDTVGIHVRHRTGENADVPMLNGSVTIHDNIVHDIYADCVQLGGIQTTNSIYNNTFYNFGEGGIDLKTTSYSDVYSNEIYRGTYGLGGSGGGNSNISMHASASGYWPGYYCEDNTIRDNYIHTSAHIGVRLLSGSPGCKVYRNTFKSIRTSITLYSCPGSEIYSNIFICNTAYTGSGVDQSAIRFCALSTNNVKVFDNSFYLSSNSHFYGIAYEGSAGHGNGNEIRNNIIQMTRDSSTVFPFYYDGEGEAPVVNHNIFYNSSHSNRVNWGGTIYDSTEEAAWIAAGHTRGIFTNPQLVNPSIDDFHLQSTSPAIDAGIDVGLTSDFEGNVVPYGSGPDIGAFEFIGIACLPIGQTGWELLYVDSEELVGEGEGNGAAINSFDGDPDTFWTTQWYEIDLTPTHPHEIQIDLGGFYDICGFRQLPRQGEYPNGMIKDYEFYVSGNGVTWGTAVASGTFAGGKAEKQVTFDCVFGRYVRLVALSEINDGPWTSVVELNVLAVQPDTDINNDGKVNIEDFAVMATWWDDDGGCVEPGWCGGVDFGMSGTVDMLDFTYFAENWLRQAW